MLTYEVTTKSAGLNLPSKDIKLQHRVLYAPLDLSYFIAEENGNPKLYFHDPSSQFWNSNTSHLIPFFTRRLQTLNGPNRLSRNYSGGISNPEECFLSPKMETEMFPGYHLKNDADTRSIMHTLLKVENGTIFTLVIFHGLADYESTEPIVDPLFSSRRLKANLYAPMYMPDHEANAIGIKEQYRFCMDSTSGNPIELCSPWQSNRWSPTTADSEDDPYQRVQETDPTMSITKRFGDDGFPSDIMTALTGSNSTRWAHFTFLSLSSVEQFLRDSTQLPLSKMFQNLRISPRIDPYNQTDSEVKAIFAMTYFQLRFGMLQLVQEKMNGSTNCGAMLFSNPDYTNFNFIGMVVVLTTFSSVIFVGCIFDAREVWRQIWFTTIRDTLQREFQELPTCSDIGEIALLLLKKLVAGLSPFRRRQRGREEFLP
jgi:hypothetical protein